MAPTDPVTDEPEACPYLGLPDDHRTRFTFATPAHRCHVNPKPSPIDLGHQGSYCLSSDFPTCKRFRAPAAAIGARAEPARKADRAVATAISEAPSPVAPAPAPTVRSPTPISDARSRLPALAPTVAVASSTRRLSVRHVVLLLLVLLAAAVLIGAIATGTIGLRPGGGAPGAMAPSPGPSQTIHVAQTGESLSRSRLSTIGALP